MEYLILVAVLVLVIVIRELFEKRTSGAKNAKDKAIYLYERKTYLMTKSENDFMRLLVQAVGPSYYVFPQVHLSALITAKANGQNFKAAFRHINGKSVDFVICDKQYCKPVLAIELDDITHDAPHRQARDAEVERMLQEANLPLLRFKGIQATSSAHVTERISAALH